MDLLWSASTTMRNPERAYSFLATISELEGYPWNESTQVMLQCLLIQHRHYVPTKKNLSQEQIRLLNDYTHDLSYEESRDIFVSKRYVDGDMRGRTSFDPIEKMGLVSLDYDEAEACHKIHVTDLGTRFLNGDIGLEDVVFSNLLKFQYPNPLSNDRKTYNTKPFINTLRLIKRVDELCDMRGEKVKGVSRDEFGIFVLSIKSYNEVERKAEDLLAYRQRMNELNNEEDKEAYRTEFTSCYLSNFIEPVINTREYTDNIIRYLRLTKYIFIRGGGYYVDLEPRRMVEINALLETDNGSAQPFSLDEYKAYIANYEAYVLPFETMEKLTEIAGGIISEISKLQETLGITDNIPIIETEFNSLKEQIESLRDIRTKLQNLKLRYDYQQIEQITEAINALKNIRTLGMKPSIALEKWANIALNIINDAILIKPNSPMGDDNEPTFTAPANVPDIECYYDGFGAICEVTMLTGRDQWFNEGQPVMRHLRDFEKDNNKTTNYCLFVAPALHVDTINTFWTAVKYEYQGEKQKIVPMTISQLVDILEGIKEAKATGKRITHDIMKRLYDECVNTAIIQDSTVWTSYVSEQISKWREAIVA